MPTFYLPDAPRLEGGEPAIAKTVNDQTSMNPTTMSLHQVAGNGFVGILSSTFALAATFQEHIDVWARTSCSVVGLIIALITLFRLIVNKPTIKR